MKDTVSFAIAKLAKQKGFNYKTHSMYTRTDESFITLDHYGDYEFPIKKFPELLNDFNSEPVDPAYEYFSAPNHFLLRSWLSEKHKIEVDVVSAFERNGDRFYGCKVITAYGMSITVSGGEVYEGAWEVGLHEALKLIK